MKKGASKQIVKVGWLPSLDTFRTSAGQLALRSNPSKAITFRMIGTNRLSLPGTQSGHVSNSPRDRYFRMRHVVRNPDRWGILDVPGLVDAYIGDGVIVEIADFSPIFLLHCRNVGSGVTRNENPLREVLLDSTSDVSSLRSPCSCFNCRRPIGAPTDEINGHRSYQFLVAHLVARKGRMVQGETQRRAPIR